MHVCGVVLPLRISSDAQLVPHRGEATAVLFCDCACYLTNSLAIGCAPAVGTCKWQSACLLPDQIKEDIARKGWWRVASCAGKGESHKYKHCPAPKNPKETINIWTYGSRNTALRQIILNTINIWTYGWSKYARQFCGNSVSSNIHVFFWILWRRAVFREP